MSRSRFGSVFVALADAFLCERCAKAAGVDLAADETQVWEVGSNGWLGPCVCRSCKLSIPVVCDGVAADVSSLEDARRLVCGEVLP